jgi:phosphoglycolate phosphatase-like HAD superfamily hydrolase
MIVFDVDGTLIGGQSVDWTSFVEAFKEAAGFALDDAFFDNLEEVTAQAIIHQALEGFSREAKDRAPSPPRLFATISPSSRKQPRFVSSP